MGPSVTSLCFTYRQLVVVRDGPGPQKVDLIEQFLLEISPKAKAFSSRCHWKVPKNLPPYPFCPVGPRPDKRSRQGSGNSGVCSAFPIVSWSVACEQLPDLSGRGTAEGGDGVPHCEERNLQVSEARHQAWRQLSGVEMEARSPAEELWSSQRLPQRPSRGSWA